MEAILSVGCVVHGIARFLETFYYEGSDDRVVFNE
jgi:hypothetical protein